MSLWLTIPLCIACALLGGAIVFAWIMSKIQIWK